MTRSILEFWTWGRMAPEALMAGISGHCDDGDDEIAFSFAGYVGNKHAWRRFEPAWQAVLSEFNLPYFHMKELVGRVGAFDGWRKDDERTPGLLSSLAEATGCCGLESFGAVVPLNDVRNFNSKRNCAVSGRAVALFGAIYQLQKMHPTSGTQVVIDRMRNAHSYMAQVEQYYSQIRSHFGENAPAFPIVTALPMNGPDSSRTIVELQAADFLASKIRRDYVNNDEFVAAEELSPFPVLLPLPIGS